VIFRAIYTKFNAESKFSARKKGFEKSTLCLQLGFDAAVAALGLKAHVSEADHPLLCEGTRRQRGDLALLLLFHYKDQPERYFLVSLPTFKQGGGPGSMF
jgi:hypothetical protein